MQRLHVLPCLFAAGWLVGVGCTAAPSAARTSLIRVDILFETQPGVPAALEELETVLATFDRRVNLTRYDLTTLAGATFAKEKGLTSPPALIIFINGSNTFDINGRTTIFAGLPQGQGAGMTTAGFWTIADFAWVLNAGE